MKSSALYTHLKKPLVAGLITFAILFFVSQYTTYQRYIIIKNEQKKELNSKVDLIKTKLQALVMYSYSATKTLSYIVERNGIPDDFENIAIELLDRYKYFDVVELVDANGVITHVYPLDDNNVIGFNILTAQEASSGALATIKRKDFFIAGPVNLKQGGVGIVSRVPIFKDNEFSGFSAVVTKLSTFFNDQNISTSSNNKFIYQLSRVNSETGEEAFFLDTDMTDYKDYAVPIELTYGEWRLYVVPTKTIYAPVVWFALLGIFVSLLGSWSIWYFFGQSKRYNKLIKSKLNEQEQQLNSVYETTKQQIEISESNLNKAQQIAKIGSWELDIKTQKITWSNQIYKIFKKDPKKFKVSIASCLEAVYPDHRDMVAKTYADSVKNHEPYSLIYRVNTDNDEVIFVKEQCETIYDKNNTPIKSIGIVQDITESVNKEKQLLVYKNDLETLVEQRTKELNDSKTALLNLLEDLNLQSEELEKEKQKAQSADLMKSAFLATMSHELRTPMNSIIGFSGILLKELAGPLNDEQKKQIGMVKSSGEHLLGLINDVLDISKIEAGKLEVSYHPFDYLLCLEKSIDFLLPQASKKGLTISSEISNMEITLVSDERRVEQVLLNLLSNAIKFSDKGEIKVKVHLENDTIITQVIDQGIGISKEDISKLFVPFTQIKVGINRPHEGTGLGLAISNSIIQKLGGTIIVDSQVGSGSNFTFKLPINNS